MEVVVDEPVTKHEIIKCNLRVFLPYIIHCIPATQLLTHLQYYNKGQRREIFRLSCGRPHEATQLALQILLDETGELGQFTALLEALELAGYPKIVNILSGKYVPNDQYDEKILQLFTPTVVQQLNPTELLPYLIQHGVLGEEEKQNVRAEDMNHGAIRASYILLSYLPSRVEDWFKCFLKALIECRYEDLAEKLEPDLFSKIMVQRQAEQQDLEELSKQSGERLLAASVEEHILIDEEEGDVDLTTDPPEVADNTSIDTSNHNTGNNAETLEFNELLDDNTAEHVEKANVEDNEKEIGDCQICDIIDKVDNDVEGSDTGHDEYGGARPKVRNAGMLSKGEQNDPINKDGDQLKDTYNLDKELDELLLGSGHFDGMNDLTNVEFRSETEESQLDYNIETDHDEIEDKEDKDIDLREYQKELAREGIEGENVIIMAPTNSGKTRVATRIVQEHLRRKRREEKIASVIFLVQDEILAIQQARAFAEHLPAYRTKVISGTTQRDKKEYLKDFIDKRDILVVTAQVLINSLDLGEIRNLTRFTMLVFDECHHANKKHPYNQILSKYMDLKIVDNVDVSELPQVIGMTASLGCGGRLDEKPAEDHMKQVMANMDAKCLCTVKRNVDELKRHVNPPIEEIKQVARRVDNGFEVAVNNLIDKIGDYMVSQLVERLPNIEDLINLPPVRGTEQFLQWLAAFKEVVAAVDEQSARVLNPCRHHLQAYNMGLLIYKDARVKDAQRIIDDFIKIFKLQEVKDETDNYLIELNEGLQPERFNDEPENPKLIEMQRIILEVLGTDGNARGIIFVKTRQLVQALIAWMNDSDVLKEFNAEEFVGQNAPAFKGGSTKSRQTDAMDYFRDGRHKILVATSVLEEGIDITKCNLVIRYEHVTNEIVRLQSRGRARAADSRYFVLTEVGSRIVEKEKRNRELETLMNRLVPVLQAHIEDHPNIWEQEIRRIQTKLKDEELARKLQRDLNMTDEEISIQCLNCQTEICKSTDIKLIQNSHHVIIGIDAAKRFLFLPSPFPQFEEEDLQYHGYILCVKCFYNLGGICQYKDVKFPLLKIGTWRNENGQTFKKWKKVYFRMEAFTLEDLRDVAEQRMELMDL